MRRQILHILIALTTIAGKACAQSLVVEQIEDLSNGQTQLVVSINEGAATTALQFNLKLPKSVCVDVNSVTLGVASDCHTLNVETLVNGDLLFILYSMDLKTFMNGELLRIPITAGSSEINAIGQIYSIRSARTDAESHTCDDVPFSITISVANSKVGDIDGNGTVNVSDAIDLIGHYVAGTTDELDKSVADVDGNGVINVSDAIEIIDIYINNR